MMDLSEKIKQILVRKNITPSLFADEIGIQRSSISHILAGRNKPSLDIIQKIIKRFPDLGLNWILDEEDLPDIVTDTKFSLSNIKKPTNIHKNSIVDPPEFAIKKQTQSYPVQPITAQQEKVINPERTVERILIFYSDGTFQEFK